MKVVKMVEVEMKVVELTEVMEIEMVEVEMMAGMEEHRVHGAQGAQQRGGLRCARCRRRVTNPENQQPSECFSRSGQSWRLIYSVEAGWMTQQAVYYNDFPAVSPQTKSLLSREKLLLQVGNL